MRAQPGAGSVPAAVLHTADPPRPPAPGCCAPDLPVGCGVSPAAAAAAAAAADDGPPLPAPLRPWPLPRTPAPRLPRSASASRRRPSRPTATSAALCVRGRRAAIRTSECRVRRAAVKQRPHKSSRQAAREHTPRFGCAGRMQRQPRLAIVRRCSQATVYVATWNPQTAPPLKPHPLPNPHAFTLARAGCNAVASVIGDYTWGLIQSKLDSTKPSTPSASVPGPTGACKEGGSGRKAQPGQPGGRQARAGASPEEGRCRRGSRREGMHSRASWRSIGWAAVRQAATSISSRRRAAAPGRRGRQANGGGQRTQRLRPQMCAKASSNGRRESYASCAACQPPSH
jgi:hypothetical protein